MELQIMVFLLWCVHTGQEAAMAEMGMMFMPALSVWISAQVGSPSLHSLPLLIQTLSRHWNSFQFNNKNGPLNAQSL